MTCILCRHFSLQNLPPGTADGDGLCTGYLESLPSLVEWDRPRCGLYRTARPLAPREKWLAARIAGKGEGGNAALNDPEGAPRCAEGRPATESHPCRK